MPTQCISVFCVALSTNFTFCPHTVSVCISAQTAITLAGNFFFRSVKIPGNSYGFDISDSQYDNQIAVTQQN